MDRIPRDTNIVNNKKDEFVAVLDGSYREKLESAFRHAYRVGYRDGIYQDLDLKSEKQLQATFKNWMKAYEIK